MDVLEPFKFCHSCIQNIAEQVADNSTVVVEHVLCLTVLAAPVTFQDRTPDMGACPPAACIEQGCIFLCIAQRGADGFIGKGIGLGKKPVYRLTVGDKLLRER